ncbi:MAG: hypothetical protein V8S81_08450 [Oscillospiraceae bacterium]
MRELTIGKNDAGQRLNRFVSKSLPLLPPAPPIVYPHQAHQMQRRRAQTRPEAFGDGRRFAAVYQRRILRQQKENNFASLSAWKPTCRSSMETKTCCFNKRAGWSTPTAGAGATP